MRREPRVRKDGTCALKGCSEPLPLLAVVHGDPFHSATCSREYYGIVYAMDAVGRNMGRKPSEASRREFSGTQTRRRP